MATTPTGTSGTTGSMRGSTSGGMQTGMGAGMGQRTPDPMYDLISVMYHTLQGCQTYEQYAQDAERAGQQDLAQFFRDTGQQFERCAQRGQQLLAQCLQQAQGGRSGQLHSQSVGSQSQQGAGGSQSSSGGLGGTSRGGGSSGSL
jgi:hypothetical protein